MSSETYSHALDSYLQTDETSEDEEFGVMETNGRRS